MKVISYSIFNNPNSEKWLFYTYLRGLVWNIKMNKKIYPNWVNWIQVDVNTFSDYDNIFKGLVEIYGCKISINQYEPLCKSMLNRIAPIFEDESITHLICRDADAITTYREAVEVQKWVDGKYPNATVFTIKDNNAHTIEIMGGLSGFICNSIREQYGTYDNLLSKLPMSFDNHGADQIFLVKTIGVDFENKIEVKDMRGIDRYVKELLPDVLQELWVSNLITSYCGEAGVNNMEYLRFEKQFLKNEEFESIEKKYPQIFYYHV